MGKLFKLVITIFLSTIMFGQENKSLDDKKFKFRSVQASFGVYYAKFKNDEPYNHSGLTLNSLVSISFKKNIFSLELEEGSEAVFVYFGGESQSFYNVNLLYGRELEVARWFKIEGNVGFGLYSHKTVRSGAVSRDNILGIPINANLMFYPAKRFAMGINPNVNFNSINITYSGNLVFQYMFN